ncbi:1-acyl-sn-glycerol-3-phosphate acyltransferase [Ruminiclostridium sufflavum DSM 19573]|uniref:1-acyl-sn-glycerol-3-phosphate acyltransferase n=1 Tax=Ruminiclostridium sufflavum DSM 19573 TaxID=1121337 RepID=A0A318XRQ3_9FIRM|nr:lysophospholipid acyltransferase family protein [Ruminiclostridium sufflavum]PYG88816.1 1-acyl-sn-glycerol-3-phosphate acyltransferase [Ruminiclostridium sufflavum DSM 19573]
MSKEFFFGDKYQTNGDKRNIFDKLFLNTRWYFVYTYIKVVLQARRLVGKGSFDMEEFSVSSYKTFQNIENCGGRLFIDGMDNIRKTEGPVVFVSNHMSTLETFVFPCIIVPIKKITFVIKDNLLSIPAFGPIMSSLEAIIVSRKNSRQDLVKVINQGKETILKGISVVLFPEGTRRAEFEPGKFNSMGIKLAKEAGVPVIPVAIKTDFWGNGRLIKDIGPVRRKEPICISFGEPVYISGNGKAEHKQVVDFISQKTDEFKKIKI